MSIQVASVDFIMINILGEMKSLKRLRFIMSRAALDVDLMERLVKYSNSLEIFEVLASGSSPGYQYCKDVVEKIDQISNMIPTNNFKALSCKDKIHHCYSCFPIPFL